MTVLGIDGWKGKWVVVTLVDGVFGSVEVFEQLDSLGAVEAEIIGIDMPIGLTDSPPREADRLAREAIGARRSSVFDPPPRFCLDEEWNQYGAANQESQKRCSRGISAQSFALMKLIRLVESAAQNDSRLHEIHPEVSFRMMKGAPLDYSKKSWNGMHERCQLLANAGIHLPKTLVGDLGKIPPDDFLDAAAVAWSAERIANGDGDSFPAEGKCQRMKILF